jgi:anthranilate phosphoribosyltransferase
MFLENQIVVFFNLEVARLYAYLYQQSDSNFAIIHSMDGYDEVSLTGNFKIISNQLDQILSPEDIGFSKINPELIKSGGSIEEAAKLFINILDGKGTNAQNDVVIVNSAFAIQCISKNQDFEKAVNEAKESLMSGKALQALKKLLN